MAADITLTFEAIGAAKIAEEIKKIKSAIKDATKGFDSTLSDAADEAAESFEELGEDAEEAASSLGKLEKRSEKTKGELSGLDRVAGFAKKALAGLAIAATIKKSFDFLADGIHNAFKAGAEFSKMAASLGVDAGQAQLLSQAFKETGMSAESVVPMVSKMQRKIAEGSAAFEALGMDVEALKGKSALEQMEALGEAVRKVGDQEGKMKVLMKIFEEAGPQLSKFFDSPDALANASKTLGSSVKIMSENAEAFDRAAVLISNVGVKIGTFFQGVASGVVGPLSALLEALNSVDLAAEGKKFGDAIGKAVRIYYEAFKNDQLFELVSFKLGSVAASFVQAIWTGFQWVANRMFAMVSGAASAAFEYSRQKVSDESSWVSQALKMGAYVGGPVAGGKLDGFDLSGAKPKRMKSFGEILNDKINESLADAERVGRKSSGVTNFFGNISDELKKQADALSRSLERAAARSDQEEASKKEKPKVDISNFKLDLSGLLKGSSGSSVSIPSDALQRVGGSIGGMTNAAIAPARKTAQNTSSLVKLTNEIRTTLKSRSVSNIAVFA